MSEKDTGADVSPLTPGDGESSGAEGPGASVGRTRRRGGIRSRGAEAPGGSPSPEEATAEDGDQVTDATSGRVDDAAAQADDERVPGAGEGPLPNPSPVATGEGRESVDTDHESDEGSGPADILCPNESPSHTAFDGPVQFQPARGHAPRPFRLGPVTVAFCPLRGIGIAMARGQAVGAPYCPRGGPLPNPSPVATGEGLPAKGASRCRTVPPSEDDPVNLLGLMRRDARGPCGIPRRLKTPRSR